MYNLRLKNGKWYKTLLMQLLKMMVCQNWAYINSFLNNLFIKHHFTLIVVNGCMVCPTTVSLSILSSRSKTSSSNLLFFDFRLSCFKRRVLNCSSSTRSCVIFFLFGLHFPSHSCTTIQGFSCSTSSADTVVADCGYSLTSETRIT